MSDVALEPNNPSRPNIQFSRICQERLTWRKSKAFRDGGDIDALLRPVAGWIKGL
jgi:hypothetical protein